jgi:hypothetical protein
LRWRKHPEPGKNTSGESVAKMIASISLRVAARALAGHLHGGDGEVAGADAVVLDEAALADARALDDPLVAGVEHLREVVVGDDAATGA